MSRGVYLAVSLIMTVVFAFVITSVGLNEEITVKETETTVFEETTEQVSVKETNLTSEVSTKTTTMTNIVKVNPQVAHVREESKSKYTDKEIYLFAQILYCEAGGANKAEMARVGQVVLNRLNTDYWEFKNCDTFYDVLVQENQYPETLAKIRNGIIPSKDAMAVAKGLIKGTIDSGLSEDVLWQTGFIPTWNVKVVYESQWHYYSVLA